MTSYHPEWPKETLATFNKVSADLGYESHRMDAYKSRWKLMNKILAYAKEHRDIFQLS